MNREENPYRCTQTDHRCFSWSGFPAWLKRHIRTVMFICAVLLVFNLTVAWNNRNSFRDWDTHLAQVMRWTEGYVTGDQKLKPGHTFKVIEF